MSAVLFVEVRAREPLRVEAGWRLRALLAARLGLVLGVALLGFEPSQLPELPLGPDHGEDADALAIRQVVRAAAVPRGEEALDRTPADVVATLAARLQGWTRGDCGGHETLIVTCAPQDGQGAATLR
jgi:hypothetical protein